MEKILVVEDDKNIAQLEIDYLNSSGYETSWISDGAKVIGELRQNSYDLLLLDLMLPNVDGYEICRSVRDEIDIPILMVTARTESVDVIRGLGLGADDYITKPFDPSQLVARVRSHLRQYHRLKGENQQHAETKETHEKIWGYDYVSDAATVSVHINRLREKIEDDARNPQIIETKWGAGNSLNT